MRSFTVLAVTSVLVASLTGAGAFASSPVPAPRAEDLPRIVTTLPVSSSATSSASAPRPADARPAPISASAAQKPASTRKTTAPAATRTSHASTTKTSAKVRAPSGRRGDEDDHDSRKNKKDREVVDEDTCDRDDD